MDEQRALSHALDQVPDWEAFASDIAVAERPRVPLVSGDDVENVEAALRQRRPRWAWLADFIRDARYAIERCARARPSR